MAVAKPWAQMPRKVKFMLRSSFLRSHARKHKYFGFFLIH